MKVKDLMTKELFTLKEEHKINLARDIMNWQRVRHIPVVNIENQVVGLLTHRDILKASISSIASLSARDQDELDRAIPIKEIMHKNVVTVSPETDIREAASKMIDQKIGCLPVVEDDKLVGILTEADFLTLAWELSGKLANN